MDVRHSDQPREYHRDFGNMESQALNGTGIENHEPICSAHTEDIGAYQFKWCYADKQRQVAQLMRRLENDLEEKALTTARTFSQTIARLNYILPKLTSLHLQRRTSTNPLTSTTIWDATIKRGSDIFKKRTACRPYSQFFADSDRINRAWIF